MKSRDEVLQAHLKLCSNRETYLSKTTQNEVLLCISDLFRDQIVEDIKKSKFSSVSADEVIDVSNWEQLIVFRYIKDGEDVEKWVGFVACEVYVGKTSFLRLRLSLHIVASTLNCVVL